MSDPTSNEKFNPAFLMEQVGDDQELFDHILGLFTLSYPTYLEKLRNAVKENSPTPLYEAAHYLLGEYLAIGHQPAVKIASKLEELGRSNSIEGAGPLIDQLDQNTAAILNYMKLRKN